MAKSPGLVQAMRKFCMMSMIAGCVQTGGLWSAHAADEKLDHLRDLLASASLAGQENFRLVLDTALTAWGDDRLAILELAQGISATSLRPTEVGEIEAARLAEIEEERQQRARGILYYLDPTLWDGQAELGGSTASGDTSEQALALGLRFDRTFGGGWTHEFDLNVDYARRQGVTSRERFVGEYGLKYQPWDRSYVFSFSRAEVDKFSGFDYRLIQNLGYGYEVLASERQALSIEVGAGVRYNQLRDNGGVTEFLGRLSADYGLKLSDAVSIGDQASLLVGSNTVTFENDFSLSARINSKLAARFSFGVNYESDAPAGTATWDRITRATLVYDF